MVRLFLPSSGAAVVLLAATAAFGQTPPPPTAPAVQPAKPATPTGATPRLAPIPQTETIKMADSPPGEIVESPGGFFPGSVAPPAPASSHKWFHRHKSAKRGHGTSQDGFQDLSAFPSPGMSAMDEGFVGGDSLDFASPSPYAPAPTRRGLSHKSRWKQGNPDLSAYPVPGWSVRDDNLNEFGDPNCLKKKPRCLHNLFHRSRAGKNALPSNEVPPSTGMDLRSFEP